MTCLIKAMEGGYRTCDGLVCRFQWHYVSPTFCWEENQALGFSQEGIVKGSLFIYLFMTIDCDLMI